MMQLASGAPVIGVTRGITISTTTTFYLVAQSSVTANVTNVIMYAMRVG